MAKQMAVRAASQGSARAVKAMKRIGLASDAGLGMIPT